MNSFSPKIGPKSTEIETFLIELYKKDFTGSPPDSGMITSEKMQTKTKKSGRIIESNNKKEKTMTKTASMKSVSKASGK